MKTILEESKAENRPSVRTGCGAGCCGHDLQDVARSIEKSASGAKASVLETLEDGKIAVERLAKRSRFALEDGVSEAAHNIKRNPFASVAIAFAAGAAVAFLVPRFGKKD